MALFNRNISTLLVVHVLLAGVLGVNRRWQKCSKYCYCVRNPFPKSYMSCGKTTPPNIIPRAPKYVNRVKLSNMQLGHITKNMTMNLTYCQMFTLTLVDNNITGISEDAFDNFTYLSDLSWTQDNLPIGDFKNLFLSFGMKLTNLYLKGKGYDDQVYSDSFTGLQNLQKLTVTLSNIKVFNTTSLPDKLENLDLSNNEIMSLVIERQLPHVKRLSLSGNNFADVPVMCSEQKIPMIPKLEGLNLAKNVIRTLNVSSLSCLKSLQKLIISENRIKHLNDNVFSNLHNLMSLQLSKMHALKTIGDFAFNSSSLIKLSFTENPPLHRNFNPDTLFKYAPNLETLDISFTNLKVNDKKIEILLGNLKNIKILRLVGVTLGNMPIGVFSQMKRLTVLNLADNKLSSWNRSVFGNMTCLRTINLASNNIKVITEEFFPLTFRQNIRKINLNAAPFTCTCDLLWFKTWMDEAITKGTIKFMYWRWYECKSPNTKPLKLMDFHPTVRSCTVREAYTVILTMMLALTLVLIVAGLMLYRYRWYILYWISLLRRRKQPIDRPDDLKYDGFVSYSNPDWDWVSEELVGFLEGEVGLRLCEHSRDFMAGKYIIDNVIDAVDSSRKTILVISNEYTKSAWCQFELKMVLSSFLQNEVDIIVILLEHIKACNVTSSLRALMVSTTYLEWSEDEEAKRLFREKLKNAMTDRV